MNVFKKLQNLLNQNKYIIITIVLLLICLLLPEETFARFGGGGGSRSSSGSGDGIGGLIIYIFMLVPFPFNIILVAIIIVGYIYLNKKRKQKSILNKLPGGENATHSGPPNGYDNFMTNNPDFDETKFKEKVKIAFIDLQKAWEAKDMSKVRKYISDGMYQRLNTQFKMMDILAQKNTIEKLNVKTISIDKIESDGKFDVIHVAIHASIIDKFISEKYKELNSGGAEEFVEYWSFIKKRGVEEKDIFSTNNCPKCGGELPKNAGEVAKCEYCGTFTNSGEYDWVLAEVTQADDYISANPATVKAGNLQTKVRELIQGNEDFSVQLIEDKASNGYLQIQTASVFKDPAIMRRFVTDAAFEKLSNHFETENKYVYNRIFINDVTLIGAMQKGDKNILMIAIKSSYQRVQPNDKKVVLIDPLVATKTEVLFMERNIQAGESKGSIYSHSCPNCGGPTGDTLNLKCQYCGAELNSSNNEWIVSDLMNLQEYYSFYSANGASFVAKVDPDKLDGLYKVRDYAFNNVLIMIAADGVFDAQEKEFAEKLAKKWGYNLTKIQPMFQMAQSHKLVLRMPEDQKMREKIYKLMEKAANIDGNISAEEQNILNSVKAQYLN